MLITLPPSKIIKYIHTEKTPYYISDLNKGFFQRVVYILEISKYVKITV